MIFLFLQCAQLLPVFFGKRRGENQALKCKVMCANHHLQQQKLHPHTTIPGEDTSYLRGKDRCLFCPHRDIQAHPRPESLVISDGPAGEDARDGSIKEKNYPAPSERPAASHKPGCIARVPLAWLSDITAPVSPTAQTISGFKFPSHA